MINLELNACMGGMSEGFRRAGINFDIAIDYDRDACDSHERNLGLRPIQIDIRDLLRMARIGAFAPDVDLFVADPPCTPWSMAGDRKGLDDERDLLRETVELILLLRPEAAIIGNVPGLDKGDNWDNAVVPIIIEPLGRAGYHVDYQSFNAADFGTPQCRHRPFWFAHPNDTPCIKWPTATHAAPPVLPGVGLKPWVPCGEALESAFGPRESWGPEVGRSVRLRRRAESEADPIKKARAGKKPRASDPNQPAATVTATQGHGGAVLSFGGGKHPPSRLDRVATTVRPNSARDGGVVVYPTRTDR